MMKKLCFLFLICTLLLFAGCQKDDNQPAGQASQSSENVAAEDTAENNEKGDAQIATEPVEDDGKVPVWHLKGQRPAEGSYYQTSHQYTYDENGNEVRRDHYSGESLDRYYTYTYDQAGNETSRTAYGEDGEEEWQYVYAYDANGNQTEWLRYEDGKMTYKFLYSYNENGDMTESLYYSGEDDDRPSKATYKYSYLEDGRIAERTYYQGVNERSTNKYVYYENGALHKIETWDEGVCTKAVTYNENGAPVELEWTITIGDETEVKKRVFTYDDNGNMTERKLYTNDELTEHYYYDYIQIRVLPEKVDTVIARQKELLSEYQ